MLPEAQAALDDFLSREPERIHRAMRVVALTPDMAVLRTLAPHADAIEAATDGIDLGGGYLPNRVHLATRISELRAVAEGRCLCRVAAGQSLASPRILEDRGLVTVLDEVVDHAAWTATCTLRCNQCGTSYSVLEVEGGHMPSYRWTEMPGA